MNQAFMREAIRLSREHMAKGAGGPFGCVVVHQGKIIGRGWNRVLECHDPTAHAEIMAIQEACKTLGSHQLAGCEIYASSEPCPMCFGAIYWARPDRVYYANSRADAAEIGFDDSFIYEELRLDLSERKIPFEQIAEREAKVAFKEWEQKADKVLY